MFADGLRGHPVFKKLAIRPNADGTGQESLTGVGGRDQKKVDVIASNLASGLQVALSLKAENFASDGKYGRNLKNRLYELQDEVRAIHEYQPRALVVGVFFLPLDASFDKPKKSSFARTVANLRARTGRLDFSIATQLNRLDWAVVGLYVPDFSNPVFTRGTVRFFDVDQAPPLAGRPRIESTMTFEGVIDRIADEYRDDDVGNISFAPAESDPPSSGS